MKFVKFIIYGFCGKNPILEWLEGREAEHGMDHGSHVVQWGEGAFVTMMTVKPTLP